jgi:hypothetical protein
MVLVMEATALTFARAARAIGPPTRGRGLLVPGFRSPPRLPDTDRSLRRRPGGTATVSVRIRGRPGHAVLSDMVEGVVAANRVSGPDADGLRRDLWGALEAAGLLPAADVPQSRPGRHLRLARDPAAA